MESVLIMGGSDFIGKSLAKYFIKHRHKVDVLTTGSIDYEGVNLKGRHVVIVCDLVDEDSNYLKECIKLCKELKASHVVAVPLMLWNPELIDNLTEESIKAELSHENRPLS